MRLFPSRILGMRSVAIRGECHAEYEIGQRGGDTYVPAVNPPQERAGAESNSTQMHPLATKVLTAPPRSQSKKAGGENMDAEEEKHNPYLETLQRSVGCAGCSSADHTRLGFEDVCKHPNGIQTKYGQLTCHNRWKPQATGKS